MVVSNINIKNEQAIAQDNSTHAIVIGSGIAGLVTAEVLTKHFDQVIIIERDRPTDNPATRQGVPQSHQSHILLIKGHQMLEQLFPGLQAELADKGAPLIDWAADASFMMLNRWCPRFSSPVKSRTCRRIFLENLIRERVINNQAVKFLEKTQVIGLLGNVNNTAVTGVQVRDANGTPAELSAQLVVDASGRNSKTPQWLQSLGYEQPKETVIKSFFGYAARLYESLSSDSCNGKAVYIMPQAPDNTRGGTLCQVEGDRWMVALIGAGRDYPPTDEDGFLEFARSLANPMIYEAMKHAQPISPIHGYQRTENRWCHYEQLAKLPENFVVLGDAACTFNPVYGQGMTIAAMGALTLDKCLQQQRQWRSHKDLTGLARRFQKQLAKVNELPWMMATSDDFRWPATEGGKPNFMTRLMYGYFDQIKQAASDNPQIHQLLLEVIHLIKSPATFFHPSILMQVLFRKNLALNLKTDFIEADCTPQMEMHRRVAK